MRMRMKMLKKYIFLLAGIALMAGTLSGCGKEKEPELLSEVSRHNRLIVATEASLPPWAYHDEKGQLTGFEVDVANAIGEKLGVNVMFYECNWDDLFKGLDSGKYDILISSIEKTPEREEKYQFTDPYAYMKIALAVSENNTDINSFKDLNGKKTCNAHGSTYAMMAADQGADVENVGALSTAVNVLVSGQCDAVINTEVSIEDYMDSHPDVPIKIAALSDDLARFYIPLRKETESDSLKSAINDALKELSDDGTLTELSIKYFGRDISNEESARGL